MSSPPAEDPFMSPSRPCSGPGPRSVLRRPRGGQPSRFGRILGCLTWVSLRGRPNSSNTRHRHFRIRVRTSVDTQANGSRPMWQDFLGRRKRAHISSTDTCTPVVFDDAQTLNRRASTIGWLQPASFTYWLARKPGLYFLSGVASMECRRHTDQPSTFERNDP